MAQRCPFQISICQIGMREKGHHQIKIGPRQTGLGKPGPSQVGSFQTGASYPPGIEGGALEIGSFQVGVIQTGAAEVGLVQICMAVAVMSGKLRADSYLAHYTAKWSTRQTLNPGYSKQITLVALAHRLELAYNGRRALPQPNVAERSSAHDCI
jgi:hypothetical protein